MKEQNVKEQSKTRLSSMDLSQCRITLWLSPSYLSDQVKSMTGLVMEANVVAEHILLILEGRYAGASISVRTDIHRGDGDCKLSGAEFGMSDAYSLIFSDIERHLSLIIKQALVIEEQPMPQDICGRLHGNAMI